MGYVNRDPNPEEMEQLKALLEREMQRGAFGMSLGLIYPPSAFSAREELVELAKVIAKYDGILAVHMRNEGPKLFEAVDEMIDIAEKSGVHIEISHLKLMGTPQWGRSPELIAKLEDARARGLNITCDQYPFTASSTSLSALVPHWAHEGGKAELVKRLQNDDGSILADMRKEMDNRGGSDAVLVVSAKNAPQWQGKTLTQLGEEFGVSPIEAAKKVLIDCDGTASCVYFSMNEADMLRIMNQFFVCVGSDGGSISHDPAHTTYIPHPRYFSAFVRFFQTVREHNLMPLEDAVYKVTALPASILGIKDRGILAEGMQADIAVFDPATIGSKATFLESRVWPDGVHHVIVNGQVALRDGKSTGLLAGKTLLKESTI
jgi:N-acyl-D-amino-acid deacylase